MKKITIIIFAVVITFSAVTAHAQKAERVQFDKAAAKRFKKIEKSFDVYLSGELIFTNPKFDTIITSKKGRPVETVKDLTTTAKIRYKEVGKIDHWLDDTLWVIFSTEDKQVFTIPFISSGSGTNNENNTLIVRMDRIPVYGLDRKITHYKETNYVTLAGKQWTLSDNSMFLEYEPVQKQKEETTKLVSKGSSTKKK